MPSDATRQARTGRPKSLDIRGDRVLDLRNELRLNQEALAKAVYADQGRHRHVTEEALRQAAYRWEAGKVARKDLEPLARVLKTTVGFLLGGAPAPESDRLKEIEQQLESQLEAGNPATRSVVERHRQSDPEEDFASSLRSVAEWVTASLEAAQLTRRQAPLEGLMQVMGWDEPQTRAPANGRGMWLLAEESRLGSSAAIVHGLPELIFDLQKATASWLKPDPESERPWTCPDARVVFRDEAPWFRVHLHHPTREHRNVTFSFVRCEPSDAGLKWTHPTARDRARISDLPHSVRSQSNFVIDFCDPDMDVSWRNLRLLLERVEPDTSQSGVEADPANDLTIVSVIQGDIAELPASMLDSFRREGFAHSLVVSWLRVGLWPVLSPLLDSWPRECWKFQAFPTCITVDLQTPLRVANQLGREPRCLCVYRIRLVELRADGSLRSMPWREDGVQETLKHLQEDHQRLPTIDGSFNAFVGPPIPRHPPSTGD